MNLLIKAAVLVPAGVMASQLRPTFLSDLVWPGCLNGESGWPGVGLVAGLGYYSYSVNREPLSVMLFCAGFYLGSTVLPQKSTSINPSEMLVHDISCLARLCGFGLLATILFNCSFGPVLMELSRISLALILALIINL